MGFIGKDRRSRPQGPISLKDHFLNKQERVQPLGGDVSAFGPVMWWPWNIHANPAFNSFSLSATTQRVGCIFVMPNVTGQITHLGFRVGSLTSAATMRISLQTVNTATGDPTGTELTSGTTTPLNFRFNWVSVTAYTFTPNTAYAIVVQYDGSAGTADVGKNLTNIGVLPGIPLGTSSTDSGSTWTKVTTTNTGGVPFGIKVANKSVYIPGFFALSSVGTTTYNNASAIKYRGNKIKLPFRAKIGGAIALIDSDADWELIIYDNDGSTELYRSETYGAGIRGSGSASIFQIPIGETVYVDPEQYFYMIIQPTSASNISIAYMAANSSEYQPFIGASKLHTGNVFECEAVTATAAPTSSSSWTVVDNTIYNIALGVSHVGY